MPVNYVESRDGEQLFVREVLSHFWSKDRVSDVGGPVGGEFVAIDEYSGAFAEDVVLFRVGPALMVGVV